MRSQLIPVALASCAFLLAGCTSPHSRSESLVLQAPAGARVIVDTSGIDAGAGTSEPAADGRIVPTLGRSAKPAPGYSKFQQRQAGFSPGELARIQQHCLSGLPTRDPSFPHGPTRYVARAGYVLEHSSVDRIPLWVAEYIVTDQLTATLPRSNPFRPDPLLPEGERAELADYRGSGLTRGHMAPNANQTVDDELRRETFFLSNMVPQDGQHNSGNLGSAREAVP